MPVSDWILVNAATGAPVDPGTTVTCFRGEPWRLDGGRPPHRAGSTGRVWVTDSLSGTTREFFPGVFGLEWTEVPRG